MQNSLEITENTTFQFINLNASLIFKIEDEELFVRVTDGQGRELANVVLNNIEKTISTQNWHTGVYFLSISSATKSTTQAIYVQSFMCKVLINFCFKRMSSNHCCTSCQLLI